MVKSLARTISQIPQGILETKAVMETIIFFKFILIIVGSIFAGYTVSDMNPHFLDAFNRVWVQFIIFLIVAASIFDFSTGDFKLNVFLVILAAAVTTTIMQIIKSVVKPVKKVKDFIDTDRIISRF